MTRCEWASCRNNAVVQEDGWWHCRPHLDEHREFSRPVRPVPLIQRIDAEQAAQLVAHRNAQQYPDTVIAAELGCDTDRVRAIRRAIGLDPVGGAKRVAQCGTRSGYARHKTNHETPCPDCTAVEREYQRIRGSRRRAARRAA